MALSAGGSKDAADLAQEAVDKASGKPAGRKTSGGVSAVMKSKVVAKMMPELIVAATRLARAKDNMNSLAHKAAEDGGFESKDVMKLVRAHMSDDFGKHKAEVERQGILFNDVQPKDWDKKGGDKVEE